MQPQSDAWLLREYAEHGKESAFAEITARHTNLVYSAALRQVDSPDLAAEVAQQAFIGLARSALALSRKLAEDASLAGWLCRIARNLSLNLRRDEFRRHSRERLAIAQHDPTPEMSPDWEQLRPLLDEAMAGLTQREVQLAIDLVRDIHRSGITLVIVEHIMEVIMSLATRVVVFHQGREIARGSPREVTTNPAVIEAYLGKRAAKAAAGHTPVELMGGPAT